MSSTIQQILPSEAANERRFYSRFVPQAPICIAIDGKTEGLLLNISENGLLVSTLTELPRNFVTQVSIPLNGLPRPVQVNVRVVWSSEARMLAGIQLINLSEFDREQIRMWGAHTSNSLSPREGNSKSVSANSATAAAEKIAATSGLLGAAGSSAKVAQKSSTVVSSLNSATIPPRRPGTGVAEKLADKRTSAEPPIKDAVAGRSEWRKLKWPLIIAGLLLSGLFLLASGALVNPFSHPTENRLENGSAAPSVLLPEQNPQASLPNTQFAQQTPVDQINPPVNRYASSHNDDPAPVSIAKVNPLVARDRGKETLTHAASVPSTVPVPRIENAQPLAVSPRNPAVTKQPDHSAIDARQNLRPNLQAASAPSAGHLTPAKIADKPKPSAPSMPFLNANNTQRNKPASALPAAPAVPNRVLIGPAVGRSSSSQALLAETHQAVESKVLRNPSPGKPAAGSSAAISDLTLPPTQQPIEPEKSVNTIASDGRIGSSVGITPLNAASFPAPAAAIPARPSIAPAKPVAANSVPSLSPLIQMDSPGRRIVELRANSDQNSFVNIPGERMLQSSSVTMHIQRSVRLPNESSGWLFHRDKEKKVAVGDLVARVEPQVPASQLAGNDSVQVRARIAADGSVESVRPLHGEQSLVPVVLKAVHAWHFQPTLVDGQPVETQSDVLIQFHAPLSRRVKP